MTGEYTFEELTLDTVREKQEYGLKKAQDAFKNRTLIEWIHEAAYKGFTEVRFSHEDVPNAIDREFFFSVIDELKEKGFKVREPEQSKTSKLLDQRPFYGHYAISWSKDG